MERLDHQNSIKHLDPVVRLLSERIQLLGIFLGFLRRLAANERFVANETNEMMNGCMDGIDRLSTMSGSSCVNAQRQVFSLAGAMGVKRLAFADEVTKIAEKLGEEHSKLEAGYLAIRAEIQAKQIVLSDALTKVAHTKAEYCKQCSQADELAKRHGASNLAAASLDRLASLVDAANEYVASSEVAYLGAIEDANTVQLRHVEEEIPSFIGMLEDLNQKTTEKYLSLLKEYVNLIQSHQGLLLLMNEGGGGGFNANGLLEAIQNVSVVDDMRLFIQAYQQDVPAIIPLLQPELRRPMKIARCGKCSSSSHRTVSTKINQVASQGVITDDDGWGAIFHGSTCPPNYYISKYGKKIAGEFGFNMDRGGYGSTQAGFKFGCIFDGVTAGGVVNAYAAQAFTDHLLCKVGSSPFLYSTTNSFESAAKSLFLECADGRNDPGKFKSEYSAEGGAATGAFVIIFDESSNSSNSSNSSSNSSGSGRSPLKIRGAAIGDSAVVLVDANAQTSIQLNQVDRFGGSARDTGGQLDMCIGISGNISTFEARIHANDALVLITDGTMDNINPVAFSQIFTQVVRSPVFDDRIEQDCRCVCSADNARLPLPEDLPTCELDEIATVSCRNVVTRLHNYVEWVCRAAREREQIFFSVEASLNEIVRTGPRLSDDQKRQCEQLARQLDALVASKPNDRSKTDDACAIAIRF